MSSTDYWDQIHGGKDKRAATPLKKTNLDAAIAHFGDLRGKRLLDLGFGNGDASVHFASLGAHVTALDTSPVAVERLSETARSMGLDNLRPVCADVRCLADYGPADFVFGSMILHHISPFDEFADNLGKVLAPSGKAYFFENSANSRLLMWFRAHLVGRYGIPKMGDPEEYPLTRQSINLLRRYFDVRIEHPEMMFLSLISTYFLRNKAAGSFRWMDKQLHAVKPLRSLSYRQSIVLTSLGGTRQP